MSNFLISLITIVAHASPFICIGSFLALVGLGICMLLDAWKKRIVQRTLEEEAAKAFEAYIQASVAEGEMRYGLQLKLQSVWEGVNNLFYSLHGTTPQDNDDLWELCQELQMPMPSLVLPEVNKPFLVELNAVMRGLIHLGTKLDNDEFVVEREDVDFYSQWVEDLGARFRLFELNNNNQQRRLLSSLTKLRELHTALGKEYPLATLNPAYQHFPGMLHVVEIMIGESSVPVEMMAAYVKALSTQMVKLTVSFELKRHGLLSDEDSFLNMLLASNGTRSK